MTKIKICGLTRKEDIAFANELRPDYIGFVFAEKSRRAVTPAQAKGLKTALSPSVRAVGVFVDENPDTVCELAHERVIDMIQLHGNETAAYIKRLKVAVEVPVIQAFRVQTPADIAAANASLADYVLLDSGAGGGQVFDWPLTGGMERPFFLAGGLSPRNVREAIEACRPFAVDLSSGVETDGKKDYDKIKALIEAVRDGNCKEMEHR